jgi:hypothetical protein
VSQGTRYSWYRALFSLIDEQEDNFSLSTSLLSRSLPKSNEELGVIWSRFCASAEGVVLLSAFERLVSKFSDIFVFFAFIPSCIYLKLA